MGVLQRFERRLEGLVEGAFAKVFKGVVEPVEIAAALQREAEDKKAILGPGRVLVPNDFVVELSPSDHGRLSPYDVALGAELAAMVREHAEERGWHFVGPVRVALGRADDLDTGVFRLRSGTAAADERGRGGPAAPVAERRRASVPPGAGVVSRPTAPEERRLPARRPRLVVAADGGRAAGSPAAGAVERVFPLDRPVSVVGRAADCDLRLEDTGVSRHHAEVRLEGGEVVWLDLGSTNGSRINGRRVERQALADADRVTIGATTLFFARDAG